MNGTLLASEFKKLSLSDDTGFCFNFLSEQPVDMTVDNILGLTKKNKKKKKNKG